MGKVQNNENKELVVRVIEDLIWEFEQKVEGYVASKQFPTCTDAIQMLSLAPWDFLCRLRLGRAFENQIKRLDQPSIKYNFSRLPGGKKDSLLVRIIKLAHSDCGSDLIDFVIYRPDLLYDKLRKEIVEPGPELDKIKKIKRKIKNEYETTLFNVRPGAEEASSLAKSAMQRCVMKFITRQEAYAKDKVTSRGRRSSLNPLMIKKKFNHPPKPPLNPGRRRTSLQLNTDLVKIKKTEVIRNQQSKHDQFADPNERNERGISPLTHLLFHRTNTLEMTMALIQAGADPNMKSKKGNDAFDAFLLNGAVFWPPLERSEIKLYCITSLEHMTHLVNLVRENPFLNDYQKKELKEII